MQNLLCIINDRLVYIKPVSVASNHPCRIVVPLSLRRVIFDALHDLLLQVIWANIRLCIVSSFVFFGHRMRKDVKARVKECPHCILTYVWRRRGQEVMFS